MKQVQPPFKGILHSCPACGFPTLEERGTFDICVVCWWEDDNPDMTLLTEVTWGVGGPNGRYSINEARRNFRSHGHMYDKGEGIDVVEKPDAARQALMRYVDRVMSGNAKFSAKKFQAELDLYTDARRCED